jgi:hypothetical protein
MAIGKTDRKQAKPIEISLLPSVKAMTGEGMR